MIEWDMAFNPLLWTAAVAVGALLLMIAGIGLCAVAGFILFCRHAWCEVAREWREIGKR